MSKCARPGCHTPAKSSCARCGREQYCSSDCQKEDWKAHKLICSILKKLSKGLRPFREVMLTIHGALEWKDDIRIMEHVLSYAEYQFGERIAGEKDYREREDGERINNWDVEIVILFNINSSLGYINDIGNPDKTIGDAARSKLGTPYQKRMLCILDPWLVQLDCSDQINSLSEDQISTILTSAMDTEQSMAASTMNGRQFDDAEGHCQRCLAHARNYRLEGEEKTTAIFSALKTYSCLRSIQGDDLGALTFAEDLYNLVVEAYDPVHHQVQEAAGTLIDILIRVGNYFDAERYAEMTLANFRDRKNGMDQEGGEIATGIYNLALVIYKQEGDLVKAEMLAREALRIRIKVFGTDEHIMGTTYDLLAKILQERVKFGDETRELYKRALAVPLRNQGPNGSNTMVGNMNLGSFYFGLAGMQLTIKSKKEQLNLSKSHYEEALRICQKIYGPDDDRTVRNADQLEVVNCKLKCPCPIGVCDFSRRGRSN